ncbi:hypothetical protein DSO57_1008494 [Entomophthora muscae]|uniref:Uncharacterized protein n=1 Tax=Entomophthora muscae TaxID=34485 RepID=A0ACC2SWS3_9FUNG|nr:hypothetical protein DSO57_1008494 [Entomophthora muscae]
MEEEGYLSHAPPKDHGQLWHHAKRIVMSLWFQNAMSVLACTYLIATSIEIVLGKMKNATHIKNSIR